MATATATNDENVSFRMQDQNRSTFWVETRPKDYKVGVEVAVRIRLVGACVLSAVPMTFEAIRRTAR